MAAGLGGSGWAPMQQQSGTWRQGAARQAGQAQADCMQQRRLGSGSGLAGWAAHLGMWKVTCASGTAPPWGGRLAQSSPMASTMICKHLRW